MMDKYFKVIASVFALAVIIALFTLSDWQRYDKEDMSVVVKEFRDDYTVDVWGETKAFDRVGEALPLLPSLDWYIASTYNMTKEGERIGTVMVDLHQRNDHARGKVLSRVRPSQMTHTVDLGNNTYLFADPKNRTSFDHVVYTYFDGAMLRFDSDVSRQRTVEEAKRLRSELQKGMRNVGTDPLNVGSTLYYNLGLGDAPERFKIDKIPEDQLVMLSAVPSEPKLEN